MIPSYVYGVNQMVDRQKNLKHPLPCLGLHSMNVFVEKTMKRKNVTYHTHSGDRIFHPPALLFHSSDKSPFRLFFS